MIVYTAGPYQDIRDHKGLCKHPRENNVAQARAVAIALWDEGYTVICPHLNTLNFEHFTKLTSAQFVEADLEIVSKMDALVMLPNWEHSKGAVSEKEHAEILGIPVVIWPERP
jgi:hypothetical protein